LARVRARVRAGVRARVRARVGAIIAIGLVLGTRTERSAAPRRATSTQRARSATARCGLELG
jgi:hypothetical protein